MSPQLDPRVSLATAFATQPGVYALLLGSGVSTGAGIPTGWGVVDALVRRAAAASGTLPDDDFDADAWWTENGDGAALGYSSVLEQLGSTRAARRAVLAGFFEPSDEDRDAELKVPGPAHEAIATLVRKGIIRVIVTTNFDRLIERALEAEGISPQVISSDAAIAGMEPMQHMACTVVKLHGDYASLDQRNTVDELSSYPKHTNSLLSRIFDEYGVVVSGWSGDWDPALVSALSANANRRYPLFWSARSKLGEVARSLTARTGAQILEGASADEFFTDILTRVEAVEAMSDSPQSLGVNITRVKRALPDPKRRIELRDLFDQQLDGLRAHLAERPTTPPDTEWASAESSYMDMTARSDTLARMLATGIYLDRNQEHADLWVHVIQSALRARRRQTGTFSEWFDDLQHLPALILLIVGSAAALAAGDEGTVVRLQTEPKWADPFKGNDSRPAFDVIHSYNVLNPDLINGFPSATSKWLYPQSHFLKTATMPMIESIARDPGEAEGLFNKAEYRAALATAVFAENNRYFMRAAPGEFLIERSGMAISSAQFWAEDLERSGGMAVWRDRSGLDSATFDERLTSLTESLQKMTRWG